MTVRLTEAAVADLQEIYAYTKAKWGVAQADNYVASLWQLMNRLVDNPDRWRRRDDLFPDCRIASHRKHVVLFRRGDCISIVRILHGAMDFPRQLDGG